jgi:hypothetical protein
MKEYTEAEGLAGLIAVYEAARTHQNSKVDSASPVVHMALYKHQDAIEAYLNATHSYKVHLEATFVQNLSLVVEATNEVDARSQALASIAHNVESDLKRIDMTATHIERIYEK